MTFLGVAIFAYYAMAGCDLKEAGLIQSSNEVSHEHLQSKYKILIYSSFIPFSCTVFNYMYQKQRF